MRGGVEFALLAAAELAGGVGAGEGGLQLTDGQLARVHQLRRRGEVEVREGEGEGGEVRKKIRFFSQKLEIFA